MSSFSNDSQKLHVSLISQFTTQHLSPAIGLLVFSRLILFTSNPLWLISSFKEGIRWILINSWNGFFSIGSSFLGLEIVSAGTAFSFFISTLEVELFWDLSVFDFKLIFFSDLTSFTSSELDLLLLSDISLF